MGVVRLLCITILFAACLVAAQDCSGQGQKNGHGDCVCQSGFSDANCATPFSACSATYGQKSSNIKADRHPTLDVDVNKISFTANTLKLSIVSELVPNRNYTNIAFVPQSANPSDAIDPKCNLMADSNGASLWAQHAQTSGSFCRDEFQFTMFWGDWKPCGFAEQSTSADYWVYKARFVIYYSDEVPYTYDPDTTVLPEMTRKSSVSYTVYTRFLKVKTLETYLDISVNNTVAYKVAITRFDYDPSSMNLTMGISTMVWWPNRMDRETMMLAKTDPAAVTGYTILNSGMPVSESVNVNDEATHCLVGSGNCLQYYEFIIHLDSGCDFNGDYVVYGVASTCRDQANNCTKGYQTAHIDVKTSDVCGSVTAEPTVDGYLTSYSSEDNTKVAQSEFIVGTRGYFEVEMTSQQNAFNLTWIDIWVVADRDVSGDFNDRSLQNIQWLFKDGVTQTAGFRDLTDRNAPTTYPDFNTVYGTHTTPEPSGPCDLEVNTDASKLSQNSNTAELVFTPHFNFRFDSRIFPIPLNQGGLGVKTVGYTLHARGHIVYAGNEKYGRTEETVDFVWSTDAAGFDGKVKFALAQSSSASEVAESNNSNTALIASLAPVAGIALVVVAAAVVAVVIIKRRKSTSTFATLN